ncbi:serine/threonine protein kinase [Yinghuangia sp. ASG 101]|nr:serine/threonine protein kinase [Yinghuangia sp. ASG 101]
MAHPGIPRLLDTGSYRTVPFIVMELVEGKSLANQRHLTSFAVVTAVAIAYQTADALAAAHRGDIVHRDLKPENVMIREDGVCTLIDFGIAKPLGANVTNYTRNGSTLGSKGYQAPEQLMNREPTTLSDIYSLGCVFYVLFAGRRPFLGTGSALDQQHLHDLPDRARKWVPYLPSEIDDLIARMLAKAPQERPDIGEVLDVLRPFLPSEGDPVPQPGLDQDPTLPYRLPDATPRREPTAPVAPPRPPTWLTAGDIDRLCASVEAELAADAPGDAVAALADCAHRARTELGRRNRRVVRMWRLAAEGLRLVGSCHRAAEFYRDLRDDAPAVSTPSGLADRTRWALRFAECRLLSGEIAEAVEVLREAGPMIARLPDEISRPVREARDELEIDVLERSTEPGIDKLLRSFHDS